MTQLLMLLDGPPDDPLRDALTDAGLGDMPLHEVPPPCSLIAASPTAPARLVCANPADLYRVLRQRKAAGKDTVMFSLLPAGEVQRLHGVSLRDGFYRLTLLPVGPEESYLHRRLIKLHLDVVSPDGLREEPVQEKGDPSVVPWPLLTPVPVQLSDKRWRRLRDHLPALKRWAQLAVVPLVECDASNPCDYFASSRRDSRRTLASAVATNGAMPLAWRLWQSCDDAEMRPLLDAGSWLQPMSVNGLPTGMRVHVSWTDQAASELMADLLEQSPTITSRVAEVIRADLTELLGGGPVEWRAAQEKKDWRIPDDTGPDFSGPRDGSWQRLEQLAEHLPATAAGEVRREVVEATAAPAGRSPDHARGEDRFLGRWAACPWVGATESVWREACRMLLLPHSGENPFPPVSVLLKRWRLRRCDAAGEDPQQKINEIIHSPELSGDEVLLLRLLLPPAAVVREDDRLPELLRLAWGPVWHTSGRPVGLDFLDLRRSLTVRRLLDRPRLEMIATEVRGWTAEGWFVEVSPDRPLRCELPMRDNELDFDLAILIHAADQLPRYRLEARSASTSGAPETTAHRLDLGSFHWAEGQPLRRSRWPFVSRLGACLPHDASWQQWTTPLRVSMAELLARLAAVPVHAASEMFWGSLAVRLLRAWPDLPVPILAGELQRLGRGAEDGYLQTDVVSEPLSLAGNVGTADWPAALAGLLGVPPQGRPLGPQEASWTPQPPRLELKLATDTIAARPGMVLAGWEIRLPAQGPARLAFASVASRDQGSVLGELRGAYRIYQVPLFHGRQLALWPVSAGLDHQVWTRERPLAGRAGDGKSHRRVEQ